MLFTLVVVAAGVAGVVVVVVDDVIADVVFSTKTNVDLRVAISHVICLRL